jgi:acyl carrier protein
MKGVSMSAVEETIKDIIVKIVHCDREVLTPTATFQDMKADSLDMVQVLVAIEDEFDIEIPDEDAQKFQNFSDFIAYVEARVAEKKGNA